MNTKKILIIGNTILAILIMLWVIVYQLSIATQKTVSTTETSSSISVSSNVDSIINSSVVLPPQNSSKNNDDIVSDVLFGDSDNTSFCSSTVSATPDNSTTTSIHTVVSSDTDSGNNSDSSGFTPSYYESSNSISSSSDFVSSYDEDEQNSQFHFRNVNFGMSKREVYAALNNIELSDVNETNHYQATFDSYSQSEIVDGIKTSITYYYNSLGELYQIKIVSQHNGYYSRSFNVYLDLLKGMYGNPQRLGDGTASWDNADFSIGLRTGDYLDGKTSATFYSKVYGGI